MSRNLERSQRSSVFRLLGTVLILVGIGTVAYQLWPEIAYQAGLIGGSYPYPSQLEGGRGESAGSAAVPTEYRLVIPEISVDVPVLEGAETEALDRGVYHHVETSQPGEAGNVVIAGHRVRRAFTLLHRLEPGDAVIVYREGIEHDYEVVSVFEVGSEDVGILASSEDERLTLYTCTPSFVGNRRTVVVAAPVER